MVTRYDLQPDFSFELFFRRAIDKTRKSNRNDVSTFAGLKFPSGSLIERTVKVVENDIKMNGKSDSVNTWQFDSLVSQRQNPLEIGQKVISYLQQLISWRCLLVVEASVPRSEQQPVSSLSLSNVYQVVLVHIVTAEIITHSTTLVVTDTDYIDRCK